jgi:hypothetical protein
MPPIIEPIPPEKNIDFNEISLSEILRERQERDVEIHAFGPLSYSKHPELYPNYSPPIRHKEHYCSVCGCTVARNPPIPDDSTEIHVCVQCRYKESLAATAASERVLGVAKKCDT